MSGTGRRVSFGDDYTSEMGSFHPHSADQDVDTNNAHSSDHSESSPNNSNSSTVTTTTAATDHSRGRTRRSQSRGSKSNSIDSRNGVGNGRSSASPMKHGRRLTVSPVRVNGNADGKDDSALTTEPRAKRPRLTKETEDGDDASTNMNGHHANGDASRNGLKTPPMSLRSATRQTSQMAAKSHLSNGHDDDDGDGGDDDAAGNAAGNAAGVISGDRGEAMSLGSPKAPSGPERSSQAFGSNGRTSFPPPNRRKILRLGLSKSKQALLNGPPNSTVPSIEASTKDEEDQSVSPTTGEPAVDGANSDDDNTVAVNANADESSPEKNDNDKISPSEASVESAPEPRHHHHHLRQTPNSRRVSPRTTARETGTATPTSVASRSNANTNGNGNGRGRGAPRGRARGGRRAVNGVGRGAGVGRGRYPRNTRGRGGRLAAELEVHAYSIPGVRALKDRQRELDRVYRSVAQTHRGALGELASRNEQALMKDPEAHRKCVEWLILKKNVSKRFEARLRWLTKDLRMRRREANLIFEGNKRIICDRMKYNLAHIQRDLFLAAQGELVCRLEDFLHGKSSLPESDRDPFEDKESIPGDDDTEPFRRTFVRGFNSATARKVETARLVDVAMERWGWLKGLIGDPKEFDRVIEARMLELKEQDEKQAEAEEAEKNARQTEAEAAKGRAMFDSLAEVCSNQLDTIEETREASKNNLTALANLAANEKPDSGKSSEETLIAESEEKVEEERDQHGRVAQRRYSLRSRQSLDEGRRARLAEEPRPIQLPPPAHQAGHPPEQQPLPPQHPPSAYHPPQSQPPVLPPPPSHYRPGMQLAPLHFLEETKHHMTPSQPLYPWNRPPPMAPPPSVANSPYRLNNPYQRVILPQPATTLYAPVSAPLPPTAGPPPSAHYGPVPLPPPGVFYPPHPYPASGHLAPGPAPGPAPPAPHPPPGEHERKTSFTGRKLLPNYGPPQPHTAPAGAQPMPLTSIPPGPALPPPLQARHPIPEQYAPRHPDPYYNGPPPGPLHPHPHRHAFPPLPQYPSHPSSGVYGPPYPHEPIRERLAPLPPPHSGRAVAGRPPSPYSSPYGYESGAFYPRNNPYHLYHDPPPPAQYESRTEHHHRHHHHHQALPPRHEPAEHGRGPAPPPEDRRPEPVHRGERMVYAQQHASVRRRSSEVR